MTPDPEAPENVSAGPLNPPLSAIEARVLGCLIEKELATPGAYPLTLNSIVNACNQRSNRDPVMSVGSRETEVAVERLRARRLVALFAGAEARAPKFKQRIDGEFPMEPAVRAMMGELLLRGPQTAAGLRSNAARLHAMPDAAEIEAILADLAARPAGALVCKLARQPGQKEARWTQLLTGVPEQGADSGPAPEPLKVAITLPPEAEARLAAIEAEIATLRSELERLSESLGGQ